jgi:hypothetical protein
MSIRPAMKSASRAGPSIDCKRRGDLVRDLRKKAQDLGCALLERLRASLDVGFRLRRLGDELHARDEERIAFQELQRAESAARPGRWRDARRRAR